MSLDDLERKHDRLQNYIFIGVTIGSVGLALQELIDMLAVPVGWSLPLSLLTLAGWLFGAWAMISTSSLVRDKGIENLLQDERFARIRSRSFEFGFVALLATQIILMIGNDVLRKMAEIELTVSFATNLSIAVALVASLGRFVYLNR